MSLLHALAGKTESECVDIFEASQEATYFLEREDEDLSWVKIFVPVSDFRLKYDLEIRSLPHESEDLAEERWSMIRSWISSCGSIEAAFEQSPILARHNLDGSVEIIDGWHRLTLAVKDHGLTSIPVILGFERDLVRFLAQMRPEPQVSGIADTSLSDSSQSLSL